MTILRSDFLFPFKIPPKCGIRDGGRFFGAPRPGRLHAGVDLIADPGVEVYAMADGVTAEWCPNFYGMGDAIAVIHDGVTCRYCEIHVEDRFRSSGIKVAAGDLLGKVCVMFTGPGHSTMLHLEMYKLSVMARLSVKVNGGDFQRHPALVDPTEMVEAAGRVSGIRIPPSSSRPAASAPAAKQTPHPSTHHHRRHRNPHHPNR